MLRTLSLAMSNESLAESTGDFNLQCPYDGHRMEKVEVGKFTIDRCGKCGGLWFDMAELQRFIAHQLPAEKVDIGTKRGGEQVHAGKTYKCPRDQSDLILMSDVKQAHIKFHSCTVCGGIMLDAGELKDISEFTVGERVKAFFRM